MLDGKKYDLSWHALNHQASGVVTKGTFHISRKSGRLIICGACGTARQSTVIAKWPLTSAALVIKTPGKRIWLPFLNSNSVLLLFIAPGQALSIPLQERLLAHRKVKSTKHRPMQPGRCSRRVGLSVTETMFFPYRLICVVDASWEQCNAWVSGPHRPGAHEASEAACAIGRFCPRLSGAEDSWDARHLAGTMSMFRSLYGFQARSVPAGNCFRQKLADKLLKNSILVCKSRSGRDDQV